MTDPIPTRAEVERIATQLEQEEGCGLPQLAADMLRALRERAEAAEAERDAARDESLRELMALEVAEHCRAQLTAARRAEAAAWNDAIEAAAATMANGDLMEAPDHEPWFINRWRSVRALRRAAPTEGEA